MLKWNMQQLRAAKHRQFSFDETVNLDRLKEVNEEIRSVSPVQVRGEAIFTGNVVRFPLHITGTLILPCSRTLADVEFPFDLTVEEQFTESDYVAASDEDIHLIEGETVDLLPFVEEHILLEMPMQVFAEDGEQGEAPPQGKGWELITEPEAQEKKVDPRLADLAKFFDKQ